MAKKIWTKPEMKKYTFAADQYVAACGDSGTVYKFTCDAGGGKSGDVYLETNNEDGLQDSGWWGKDQYLSGYHACGITHEAESTDQFLKGYFVYEEREGRNWVKKVMDVIVWRGPESNNTHCTTNLDMSTWETAKS